MSEYNKNFGSIENSENRPGETISRRKLIKFALGSLAALTVEEALRRNLFNSNEETSREPENRGRRFRRESEVPRLENVDQFKDLGDGVLIICANDDEYRSVISTLEERSQKRVEGMKFAIHQNGDGTATGEMPVRRHEDKGLPPGQYPSGTKKIKITVVKENGNALDNLGKNFGMIQLRGHTQNMPSLLEKFKNHRREKTILSMGGCESVQFMEKVYDKNTPIIADKMGTPAFTKHNTYMLIMTLDRLDISDSWDELQEEVSKISSRFREQTIMPGNPDYYKYVSKEKR